jgi:hypothetical protein
MKKEWSILCPLLFMFCVIQAQLPEDALRLSYTRPSGTARQQAVGGAMGSVGGDLSSNFTNPAGLGFYKTSEVLFSPSYTFQSANSSYLSSDLRNPATDKFIVNTSGAVYGGETNPGKSMAISIAVNRSADFNSHVSYQGINNYSSAAEGYASEFQASGLTIDQALSAPNLTYGTRSAIYTYLIDTSLGGLGPVINQPGKILSAGGSLKQVSDINSKGGVTEIAFSVAGGIHEKWYWGASIGVPILSYSRTVTYTESDNSTVPNNDFGAYTNTEYYSASGAAFNLKVGAIFRPTINWRIGLAVHTPSVWGITDKLSTKMITNTEGYHGIDSISSDVLDQASNSSNTLKYDLYGPWHFMLSGSYIFPGAVVSGKMGFISADIEYVTNKTSYFGFPLNNDGTQPDNSYFDPLNNTVKSYYKNNFNFRLGGEYKLNILALRLGGSYSTNPYSSPELKANRSSISGGIGYRNKGIIIDLTYVENFYNDIDFPYRLDNKDNAFAKINRSAGNIMLSVGLKF